MKKIWYGVLFTMLIMTFVSCGANGKGEKYIVEGKKAMANEEYEKAKNWFELGVKEEKDNKKYSELLKISEILIKLEEMNKNSNFEGFESSVEEINTLEALEEYREALDKLVEKTKNNKKEFEKGKVNNDKVDKVVSNKVDKNKDKDKVVSNKVDKDKEGSNKVKEPSLDEIREASKELFKGLEHIEKNKYGVDTKILELTFGPTEDFLSVGYTINVKSGKGQNGEVIEGKDITQEMINKGQILESSKRYNGNIAYLGSNMWKGYLTYNNKNHTFRLKKILKGKYEMTINSNKTIFTVKR